MVMSAAAQRACDEGELSALVEPALRGDSEALEKLFLRLLPRVRNLVRYLVRGDKDVDDLSQEALLKILNGMNGYRGDGPFRAWADRIVVRSVFMRLKCRSLAPLGDGVELLESHDDVNGTLPDYACERRRVVALLDDLPGEQRNAMVLHYVVGMSVKEIADELGTPQETVRSRLRLGKDRLKRWLATPLRSVAE